MRLLSHVIIVLLMSSCVFGPLGTSKRAIKQLEKNEILKTEKLVNKALEKDSLLPAALYAKSRLLVSYQSHEFYDSAYYFILKAQTVFDTLDVKSKDKHVKNAFDSIAFQSLKVTIDSLAFQRALLVNTESGFNEFLAKYPTAKQTLLAKSKRNALAFAKAKKGNTYQGYKNFMEKYPDAVQVSEARKRYEKLYFDKSTADGRVTSYIRFLEKHPTTPYRREAEQEIFEVMTSEHSVGGYELFVRNYPRSHLKQKAIKYAYHVAKETGKKLPRHLMSDSLLAVENLSIYELIPFFEEDRFGFMDTLGNVIIKPTFESIEPDYKCRSTTKDFLLTEGQIIGRNGAIILNKPFTEVDDLGSGLLKVNDNGKWGLMHKSGNKITDNVYDQIKLLNGNILAFLKGSIWRIETVSGRLLVADDFADVYEQGGYLFFEKEELFEVKNAQSLMRAVDNTPVKFDYIYTDYEIFEDGNLWLKSSYGEVVVDQELHEIIPYDNQRIVHLTKGLLIEKLTESSLLNDDYEIVVKFSQRAQHNMSWVIGKKDSLSMAFNLSKSSFVATRSDSLSLLGRHYLLGYLGDTVRLYFSSIKHRHTVKDTRFRILNDGDYAEYLMALGKEKTIYNKDGSKIPVGDFESIVPMGYEYFKFVERGKQGALSSSTGQQLLKAEYDAIGNYSHGNISLLKGQKFGLFNTQKDVLIPAQYEKNVVAYNDSIFIAIAEGKARLVDKNNQEVSGGEIFDEITHWTDTLAIVRKDGDWQIFNLVTQRLGSTIFQSYKTIELPSGEKLAVILSSNKYGVVSSVRGEIIAPTFNDIVLLKTSGSPIIFTEKHIHEAELYVVIYFDLKGNILKKQAFEGDQYDKIYCDQ